MKPAGWSLIDDAEAADREAAAVIDAGLDGFNLAAASLNDVRPLACYARSAQGVVIGGLIGRTWGECAELQQLWVEEAWRGLGIGAALVRRFEAMASVRGCTLAYLDTFSFQAPEFYRRLGWTVVRTIEGFAPGVAKHAMEKRLGR
jgi:GNAT superfamily N-acetyltransferase